MYRAYPAPSQPLPRGNNGNYNGNANDNKKNPYGYGTSSTSIHTTSGSNTTSNIRPPVAMPGSIGIGTRPKFGSPSLPPPPKKHRAIPLPMAKSAAARHSTSASASLPPSLVDDKIAKRRAQLRSLKAQKANSNAPSILARARAITSNANTNATTTPGNANGANASNSNITGSYLNHDQPNYAVRSRPIAVPKSPPNPKTFTPMNLGSKIHIPAGQKPKPAVHVPIIDVGGLPSKFAPLKAVNVNPNPILGKQNGHGTGSGHAAVNAPVSSPPISNPSPNVNVNTNGNINADANKVTAPPKSKPAGQVQTPATEKLIGKLLQPPTKKITPPMSTSTFGATIKSKVNIEPLPVGGDTGTGAPPIMAISQPQSQSQTKLVVESNVPSVEPEVTSTRTNSNTNSSSSSKRLTLTALRNAAKSPKKAKDGIVIFDANASAANGNGNGKGTNQTIAKIDEEHKEQTESSTLRLVKELRKAKEEKVEAMKRMTKLELEVMELRLNNTRRQIQSSQDQHEQHHRRMRGDGSPSPRRRRMKSPEPSSRSRPDSNPLLDMNIASRAVETVEDVFTSNLATYVVREPYGGNETMDYNFPDEVDGNDDAHGHGHGHGHGESQACSISWQESIESYLKKSTVKDEKTLEVLAKLEADGSILLIYGDSCRHGVPSIGDGGITGYEFRTFEDVEYLEGSLGKIVFIDTEGNDGEYWLDPVYEEALKIRETYCSNVFSAALALKASSPQAGTRPMEYSNGFAQRQVPAVAPATMSPPAVFPVVIPPVARADACVGTEDIPQPKEPVGKPKSRSININGDSQKQKSPAPETQKQKQQPAQEQDQEQGGSGATDVLSLYILSFFSTIFSVIWFILMIPVRVTRLTVSTLLVLGIANLLWLYFADNRTAMDMGALIDKQYNIN
jgi:hypothetical protein